ncbi:MAG: arginine--tRNA ligase, partial [Coriobacteriaceae bacterium]|nr:arginine--tRNA ligase [Coriobacteriaceae bacterium]
MPETIEELVRQALCAAQDAGELPEFEVTDFGIERPADSGNGDWTSTVAMRSARLARMAPARIAAAIVAHVPESDAVSKVEVAGPGFINFTLKPSALQAIVAQVREEGADYGRSKLPQGTCRV